jgi:hypothetical protein
MDEEDDGEHYYHNEKYYRDLLQSLDARDEVKKPKSSEPVDPRSPMRYMSSRKALFMLRRRLESSSEPKYVELDAREEAKINAICDREKKNYLSQKARKEFQHILEMKPKLHSDMEQRIEKELLGPFRRDKNKVQSLLEHCKELNFEKKQEMKIRQEHLEKRESNTARPGTTEQRLLAAKEKRNQQEQEKSFQFSIKLNLNFQQLNEYHHLSPSQVISNASLRHVNQNLLTRKRSWISIIYCLNVFGKVRDIVFEGRKKKQRDVVRWKAIVRLQRWYRRFHLLKKQFGPNHSHTNNSNNIHRHHSDNNNNSNSTSLVSRMKTLSNFGAEQMQIFQLRQSSAELIITFLRKTRVKSHLARLFR